MLKKILAISGHPGLFKVITESKKNVIVESIVTGKRMPAYSSSKISALGDIAIYTNTGEIGLKEVFRKMDKMVEEGQIFDLKATNDELKNYFETILPEYDRNKVYASDMKKIVQWFLLLKEKDMLTYEEEDEEQTEQEEQ